MSIEMTMYPEDLVAAQKALDMATMRGFPYSKPLFRLAQVGRDIDKCVLTFTGEILLKADPVDDRLDFGRVNAPEEYILVDGECKDYRDWVEEQKRRNKRGEKKAKRRRR